MVVWVRTINGWIVNPHEYSLSKIIFLEVPMSGDATPMRGENTNCSGGLILNVGTGASVAGGTAGDRILAGASVGYSGPNFTCKNDTFFFNIFPAFQYSRIMGRGIPAENRWAVGPGFNLGVVWDYGKESSGIFQKQ